MFMAFYWLEVQLGIVSGSELLNSQRSCSFDTQRDGVSRRGLHVQVGVCRGRTKTWVLAVTQVTLSWADVLCAIVLNVVQSPPGHLQPRSSSRAPPAASPGMCVFIPWPLLSLMESDSLTKRRENYAYLKGDVWERSSVLVFLENVKFGFWQICCFP